MKRFSVAFACFMIAGLLFAGLIFGVDLLYNSYGAWLSKFNLGDAKTAYIQIGTFIIVIFSGVFGLQYAIQDASGPEVKSKASAKDCYYQGGCY